jgi:DNA-binding SARP family transcriptional activator
MIQDLESPILEFVLNTDFQGGLQVHAKLNNPTPDDDRWAGLCLLELGQIRSAREMLTKAKDRGCQTAAIELALVYQKLGEPKIAQNVLKGLNLELLGPFNRVLAECATGSVFVMAGNLIAALKEFEQAWEIARRDETCGPIRTDVAHQLADVNAQLGKLDQAFFHLEYALKHASPSQRIHPLIVRAYAHTNAGRFMAAHNDLLEAKTHLERSPGMTSMVTYRLGLLQQMQGHWTEAIGLQLETASLAKSLGERKIEFFAETALISTHTALGQIDQARGHLARASHIVQGAREEAFVAMREGALMLARDQASAVARLEQAVSGFRALELHRETGWANLHLTEAHLKLNNLEAAHETLEQAAAKRHALGPGTGVSCELRLLPLTFDHLCTLPPNAYSSVLLQDWRSFEGATATRVHLRTLGDARVIVDGQPMKLAMRRTVEVLAFLLLNPNAAREKIFAALWPDDSPLTAANYLHQARLELARAIPGFSIAFDKHGKTYAVQCQGPKLTWDVFEIKRLLSSDFEDALPRAMAHLQGLFLPHADNAWVRSERLSLERFILDKALKITDRWRETGESKRSLEITRRLLKFEPLNPDLIESLIKSVQVLDGPAAARRELSLFTGRFQTEYGELPQQLKQLQQILRSATTRN